MTFSKKVKSKYVVGDVDGWSNAVTKSLAVAVGNIVEHYTAMLDERKRLGGKFDAQTAKAFSQKLLGSSRCLSDVNWDEISERFNEM